MSRFCSFAHAFKSGSKCTAWTLGVFGSVATLLSGCVSSGGSQVSSLNAKTFLANHDNYINGDVVTPFYASVDTGRKGLTSEKWRNSVIDARIAASNIHYGAFVRSLDNERNTIGLGSSLASLGLSGAASIAAKETANALSAAASGVTGAGAAFNQQVFAAKTVQVLVTQMDANRGEVLARLIKGERKTAQYYTIGQALSDLADYDAAGSLDRALSKVSEAATVSKMAADAGVTAASLAPYDAVLIDQDTQARKVELSRYVKNLGDGDLEQLKSICRALGITFSDAVSAQELKNLLIPELDKRINSNVPVTAAAQADTVSALLYESTKRSF